MTQGHLAELRAVLADVRRRWLAARLMRAFARLVAGVCLLLLVVLLVDLALAPPDIPILVLAGAALLALIVFGGRVLWPLRESPTDRRVARFVEERCPELEDRVASATELGDADGATAFQDLLVADAAEQLRRVDLGRVVTPTHLRGAALRGLLAVVLLAAILTLGFGPLSRVARTGWLYAFPFDVTLEVEPGDVRLLAGQPLRVRVHVAGTSGAPTRTPPALTVRTGDRSRVVTMRPVGDGYVAEFPSVTDSFVYRVTAASVTSRHYRVDALVAPRVRRIDVEYRYPSFTELAPRVEEDGGDIYAPAGTEVRLLVHADKRIAGGSLVLSDGRRIPLESTGTGPIAVSLTVETDGSYHVDVTDTDGLSNTGDAEYFIRATSDRLPEVQVLRPGGDREITPLEEVTITARADDDYQVSALELVYTVVGRDERTVTFDTPTRASTVRGTHTLYAEDLGVAPGDFITYFARARDLGQAGQSSQARSDIFFLEIRPFDNEFEEAQGQSALGRDAEDVGNLAAVQKEIIVATWRLDPVPHTGAVVDDIRAVAVAQQELRATAARAADRVQGRGRDVTARDRGPAPEQEALARAIEAMAAAQTALYALSTGTAIPAEMEALNQLLKAEAAIRRRQVSMQQGQGGQTPGQAQEDLSALFDRELRREQETSYETESSPAEQEAEQESEALRRLQELAERQEELNRELAEREEAEPDDALRRALERLTREQQELREQLEDLADQLAREQGAAGQSAGGQSGSGDLQRIADQMRRAMSELRRQDTPQARASAEQALSEMRRLEQQLRGESDGERAGALAELQLEARELADAQRRVAEEASQVEADNRSRESRFRLADEKDDLAGRVDALDRGLESLSGGASEVDPAEELVRGAREALAREAVGERMRANADRLRRAGAEPPTPGTERDPDALAVADDESALADVLDGVAEQLQRAAGQPGRPGPAGHDEETQRLAEQLAAAQELREALEQLESSAQQQAQQQGQPGQQGGGPSPASESEPSASQDARAGGSRSAPGADAQDGDGSDARPGGEQPGGTGAGAQGQARLRSQYMARLEQHPGLLEELRRGSRDLDRDLEQWAQHWASGAAPGTELFKQDFAGWESLRRNLENALQQFESDRSRELAADELRDGLTGGPDESLPERYRRLVDQYYRSLATASESPG